MTVETHVHRALDRVESEQSALASKDEALDAFADRVTAVDPVRGGRETTPTALGGSVAGTTGQAGSDRCSDLRTAFEETVTAHSGDADEPVLKTIQAELGEEVALALSPTTAATLTPGVHKRVRSAVEARRDEIAVTRRALDDESESLRDALETIDSVTSWLSTADQTSLSALGFDELATRHDRLGVHRQACTTLVERRQDQLGRTTSQGASVGVERHSLVAYLYEDFPVDYPVLSTVTRLVDVLDDARRAVRDHMVRRV